MDLAVGFPVSVIFDTLIHNPADLIGGIGLTAFTATGNSGPHLFLIIPDPSLVGYIGGPLCSDPDPCPTLRHPVSLIEFQTDPLTATGLRSGHLTLTAAAVPEPEIYAMMGIGLGLLSWVGRRRKQLGATA